MKLHAWGLLFVAGLLVTAGCTKPATTSAAKKDDTKKTEVAKKGDHSGWWCTEHGIPEEECSMCQEKVAKAFKDKGDWCKVHPDRAASQCFICNPKQAEVYAAKYRAKYDKAPPPAEENMPKDGAKKEDK